MIRPLCFFLLLFLQFGFAEIRPVRNLRAFDNSYQKNPITKQWQNKTKQVIFEWQEPYSSSEITGYYFYFGKDKNGKPERKTEKLSWTSQNLETGTYYFRILAENAEKERSDLKILEINYDPEPPQNDLKVIKQTEEEIILSYSPKKQGAKIDGINIYWGTDPNGFPDQHISGNVFQIIKKPLPGQKYYLRACLEDEAGNVSQVRTITEKTIPGLPKQQEAKMVILSKEVTSDAEDIIPGSILTYTITLTNQGKEPAQNVELSDTIPDNTSFVADSAQSSEETIIQYWDTTLNGGKGAWTNHANPENITKIRWIFRKDFGILNRAYVRYSIRLKQ